MIQVAIEKYKKVQDLNWNEAEKKSGKIIKQDLRKDTIYSA